MKKKISITLLIVLIIIFSCGIIMPNISLAADDYGLYNDVFNGKITNAGLIVAGVLRYGAIVLAVAMLMIKGIKFITASPEGKAEVKKEMIPWAIGLLILFSFNFVYDFFEGAGKEFNSNISAP